MFTQSPCKINIVEVTGMPGSGKTTHIKSHFTKATVLDGAMPVSFGSLRRVLYSIILPFYGLITRSVTIKQVWWLITRTVSYRETLIAKINALRNCLSMFGYRLFLRKLNERNIVLDEGISHIPFILELSETDINEFVALFHQSLARLTIVFIESPSTDVLRTRLIARGHKRIRSADDLDRFIVCNVRLAASYRRILLSAGFVT